ncbi:hypothetical protein [Quadrisphaera sp. DSM 44207]|uniref:hypothetical protein n=1 Tax=Quadrisphaera sp. DSM 44207 TaxID=1881057 RepID=UPI00087FCC87|nr:hypothetical protein [Quadrisphaera sp. DSM 44207]SDQ42159.1 hypothetical protein SAMN05428996_1640 [Quadrisphaera sp. DSM 44207]
MLLWPVGLLLSVLALRRADRSERLVPLVGVALSALGAAATGLALVVAVVLLSSSGFLLALPWTGDHASVEARPVPEETLAPGQSADVGRFAVAVTAAEFEADDSRQGWSPFAEPQQRGTVSLALTNLDDDARDPWAHLGVSVVGGNGREYWTEPCSSGPFGPVEVEPHQQVTLLHCVWVPEGAVADAHLLVAGADLRERAYWTLDAGR